MPGSDWAPLVAKHRAAEVRLARLEQNRNDFLLDGPEDTEAEDTEAEDPGLTEVKPWGEDMRVGSEEDQTPLRLSWLSGAPP